MQETDEKIEKQREIDKRAADNECLSYTQVNKSLQYTQTHIKVQATTT